ncbi:MAG: ketopantoate reductase family protein [Xanthobacteraceae bacterium]|jgi:2-dehydropantoate 2-reductase|uniref:ketopantoate reductase family protein n=1 Tax=Pseudolabrys sp. TaxID=1960880 RepID=UPI003D0D60D4
MKNGEWPAFAVMGAGAVGGFFGAKLAMAGAPVTLIGRPAFAEAIARNGLLFEHGGRIETIAVTATTKPAGVAGARYVLFCVKSGDTDTAAKAMAPHLAGDAVVLSLQNGVGNAERIRAHVSCPVVPALVYAASQMPKPGHVRHTGGGRLVIGGADRALLDEVVALFARADVPVTISPDIDAELWTKLLTNCAYNAVSALTMMPYAKMLAMPEVKDVMRTAAEEVFAVARARGIKIDPGIFDRLFDFAQSMPTQISSTAQDIARGRPTEIDYLNGAVVREGEVLGVATPVNRTLHALVRLLETKNP